MSSQEKYLKAKELYAKGGISQKEAAKAAGISVSGFAYYRAAEKAAEKTAKKAKAKVHARQTRLVELKPEVSALQLLVFRGNAAELAEIARNL